MYNIRSVPLKSWFNIRRDREGLASLITWHSKNPRRKWLRDTHQTGAWRCVNSRHAYRISGRGQRTRASNFISFWDLSVCVRHASAPRFPRTPTQCCARSLGQHACTLNNSDASNKLCITPRFKVHQTDPVTNYDAINPFYVINSPVR